MPPKTTKPKTDAVDNSEQPAWACKFEARLNARFDDLQSRVDASDRRMDEFVRVQKQQGESIASNSQSISDLRQQHVQSGTLLASLRENVATIASTFRSSATVASNRAPLEDACEVRVSGLPLSLDTADVATAERILVALNLSRLAPLILKVRTWAPGRSQSAPQATTSSAPSPVLPSVSAMVIRFASPSARATFLEATPLFRTLALSDIFGATITETGHLSASTILPRSQYRLYRKCCAASSNGHLPRPSLRNLSIYMRLTKDSAPTLITTEADLQRFISATHQPVMKLDETRPQWRVRELRCQMRVGAEHEKTARYSLCALCTKSTTARVYHLVTGVTQDRLISLGRAC
ncbi:unnamed protein product [Trichogramma brassicae]|uniref:Uncharacterized protein n=1 Tax=Trichogramma brassicae TaxID=86971 RepID=A0A6H5IR34_9HYME|nr:unnamed protein product [Trichogramma brassicae]